MTFAIRSALQNLALGLVVHDDLTPQAQNAFVRIDPTQLIDGAYSALCFTKAALTAALRAPVKPIK